MKRIILLLAVAALSFGTIGVGTAMADEPDYDHCGPPWLPPNYILGSLGNDVLRGTQCNDAIFGFAGDDRLIGRGGEDTLSGGRGNDRLNGIELLQDPTRDVLRGGPGFDRCIGDPEDVFISCEDVEEVSA